MSFEEQIKELEQIIAKLEGGVSLEEGVKLFERGSELCKSCFEQLDGAKGKITVIRDSLNGFVEEKMSN